MPSMLLEEMKRNCNKENCLFDYVLKDKDLKNVSGCKMH